MQEETNKGQVGRVQEGDVQTVHVTVALRGMKERKRINAERSGDCERDLSFFSETPS